MDRSGDGALGAAPRTLALELDLLRGAVAMVASGGAARVMVVSLQFGDQLIEPARSMATGTGVRIVPQWGADERCAAILVERVPDD